MCKAPDKALSAFGFALGFLFMSAVSAMANHIDTASATPSCNSYMLSVSASDLVPGTNYTIDWSITETPTSGSPMTITGSYPFVAQSSTIFAENTFPLGPLSGTYTFSGTATLVGFNTIPITFSPSSVSCAAPPPPCTAQSTNTSNFNGTPIQGGDYIWFNANMQVNGIPSSGATLSLTNSTISFTADKAYNVPVPNSQITFSPSASCSTVTFDSLTNSWIVTVPISGSDEIFLSGLGFPVPASFATVNGKVSGNVAWTGTFGSNTPGISMQWKWGAAVYTCFPSDYNLLNVKPTHQNACNLNNGDHAGTPLLLYSLSRSG